MSELLLNQFEQDRALVALRYKNLNIRKLFGKSVFIAGGGELAFSLVSSLRMVNLKKQAGIAVFLLVEDNESYDRRFDYIDSSDFSIVKYSSLNAVNKCGDILIERDFCFLIELKMLMYLKIISTGQIILSRLSMR